MKKTLVNKDKKISQEKMVFLDGITTVKEYNNLLKKTANSLKEHLCTIDDLTYQQLVTLLSMHIKYSNASMPNFRKKLSKRLKEIKCKSGVEDSVRFIKYGFRNISKARVTRYARALDYAITKKMTPELFLQELRKNGLQKLGEKFTGRYKKEKSKGKKISFRKILLKENNKISVLPKLCVIVLQTDGKKKTIIKKVEGELAESIIKALPKE